MKSGKIKIFVTHALLLYLLCFVVPPVSAIIPSEHSFAHKKDIVTIGKDNTRERMYLFDLTLWEILKRAKRSDNAAFLYLQDRENSRQHLTDQLTGISEDNQCMRCLLAARTWSALNESNLHTAGFSLAHSGLSPPRLV